MKIVFSSASNDLSNYFVNYALTETDNFEVISIKSEKPFFEEIEKDTADAYILENHHRWTQKAVDFIKKRNPYVPVIILMTENLQLDWVKGAEFYLFNTGYSIKSADISESILRCVSAYHVNFKKLLKLTSKLKKEIEFGHFYKYDPVHRNLRYKDKLVKKLSPKEGGVLEILSANFQELVKKEIIMEKVWHRTDFYTGRSMDVYITNLRNLFKKFKLTITIKNIPKEGLILEYHD